MIALNNEDRGTTKTALMRERRFFYSWISSISYPSGSSLADIRKIRYTCIVREGAERRRVFKNSLTWGFKMELEIPAVSYNMANWDALLGSGVFLKSGNVVRHCEFFSSGLAVQGKKSCSLLLEFRVVNAFCKNAIIKKASDRLSPGAIVRVKVEFLFITDLRLDVRQKTSSDQQIFIAEPDNIERIIFAGLRGSAIPYETAHEFARKMW